MKKVIIIAEAGVNHNGDINIAKRLIESAKDVGADYVKFQFFKAKNLVSKNTEKAAYQKNFTNQYENQYDMLKKLELSEKDHEYLLAYCKIIGVKFMSSPFDVESIQTLSRIDMDFFKVPSGELTNLLYLRELAKHKKKIILSTGMANFDEVKESFNLLTSLGVSKNDIIVLHCNTEYPSPMKDVNLYAMNTMKDKLGVNVGYSDHTSGIEVAIAATALGAKVIEKHFTLDKDMEGPDHKASLNPTEFRSMVLAIRNIELALGCVEKIPSESEIKNIPIVRKSIVAKSLIKKGELFTVENITVKRPGNGISPMKWDQVIGTVAPRDFVEDELISI